MLHGEGLPHTLMSIHAVKAPLGSVHNHAECSYEPIFIFYTYAGIPIAQLVRDPHSR